MAKNYNELAKTILDNIGGEENIISLTHCITRLRFKLKDETKANTDMIQNTPGVLKVLSSGGQYQIVIGTDVAEAYQAVLANSNIQRTAKTSDPTVQKSDSEESASKQNPCARLVDTISGIFLPFLGAFTGAGLLKGFLVLFVTVGLLDKDTTTYTILYAAADGVFYFMPIFLAYCAGKKFGANPFLSMAIAAAMLYPQFTALYNADTIVTFFGLPVKMINYPSSVLPIIVTCFIQSKAEQQLNRFVPKTIRGLVIPMIDLAILLPIALIIIGPVTDTAGNVIAGFIEAALHLCPPLAGFIMAALWPVMIIFGVHWGFVPISLNNLAVLGYDYIMPLTVGCNFGIGAACLAIFLKTKDKQLKETAGSASISAFIGGVTEPGVYGVLLKYRRPMTIMCLVNGISGAICASFNVTRNVQMSVNLLSTPAVYAVYGPWAIVAILISIVGTFILTYMFGYNNIVTNVKGER